MNGQVSQVAEPSDTDFGHGHNHSSSALSIGPDQCYIRFDKSYNLTLNRHKKTNWTRN